jgi:hypothetical protein
MWRLVKPSINNFSPASRLAGKAGKAGKAGRHEGRKAFLVVASTPTNKQQTNIKHPRALDAQGLASNHFVKQTLHSISYFEVDYS